MENHIDAFISYLHTIKKTSKNTELSYRRDLCKLWMYMEDKKIKGVEEVTKADLFGYAEYLKGQFAATTISRHLASIKAFCQYLYKEGIIREDISQELKAPKIEKKIPEVLSMEEVVRLLNQPQGDTPKELRDKAMLELLYATGIRVSELTALKMTDVNLSMSYIVCRDSGKERMIPFGKEAKSALQKYMDHGRKFLVDVPGEDTLFSNCAGQPMSRQGFWKLIKSYAKKADIKQDITPYTLRHSFAAHLVENGADLHSVQEMLGHSAISTTQVYANLNQNHIRKVYSQTHPRG